MEKTTDKKMVSVIVPCYNQGEFLDECLQSVFNQSYSLWECIIVNDGSTDNSEEKAVEWTKKDERFKYIYQNNDGVSATRNKAIKNASGFYILPLDADDKIGEKYIELAIEAFEKNPATDLVYCNAEYFGTVSGPWNLPPYNKKDLLINSMIYCSGIYRKTDWEKIGGYDINMKEGYEDWEFWVNMAVHTKKFGVVKLDYVGFYYRKKNDSRNKYVDGQPKIGKRLARYIHKKHFPHYWKILLEKGFLKVLRIFGIGL